MPSLFDELVEQYPAWWIDALGEHNHIGGLDATRWLLQRSQLRPGNRMLDAGAFVGAAARLAATDLHAMPIALDVNADFLRAGASMEGGDRVGWVAGDARKLPFAGGTFASVWSLDSYVAPREFTRVAAERATVCLCSEVPVDSRGGLDAFIEEWQQLGWSLGAHREMSLDATQTWRRAEAELVRRRPRFEQRYGTRGYLFHLDMLSELVRAYEIGHRGHGLFVFTRA